MTVKQSPTYVPPQIIDAEIENLMYSNQVNHKIKNTPCFSAGCVFTEADRLPLVRTYIFITI